MEEQGKAGVARKKKRKSPATSPRGGARKGQYGGYSHELRLKAVKLHIEDGIAKSLIAKEMGVSGSTVDNWVRAYRAQGEDGLREGQVWHSQARGTKKLPAAVHEKIVQIKQQHPRFGVRRISQILRRMFFLGASHETVRQTLTEKNLIEKPAKKPVRNPPKPRFFERAKPNQMWQSDIFTFRLGGKNAYLIAFLDDYSRYMVSLGLFRSQTAEHVLEVYRVGTGEYGVPKEMLTDNGRQYTNWRGSSRFEKELKKDRVQHIKSAPHHPMTLGKTERFWKTIFEEFLSRAQFGSFEEAQERIRLWTKYYNHKRPHQGIGGLCPADRFFEITGELRKVVEKGVQENTLEMALRGKPRDPFYMVGRMGQQSVVIRAEKGKVRMLVEAMESDRAKELVYDVEKGAGDEDKAADVGGDAGSDREAETPGQNGARSAGEEPGGVEPVGGEAQAVGGVPGDGDHVVSVEPVAGAGDGRYAGGAGAAERDEGCAAGAGGKTGSASGDEVWPSRPELVKAPGAAGTDPGGSSKGGKGGSEGRVTAGGEEEDEPRDDRRREGAAASRDDPEGAQRTGDGDGRGEGDGDQPQDVLQVGGASAEGDGGCSGGAGRRAPTRAGGRGEGATASGGGNSEADSSADGTATEDSRDS
jgi:transposase InsO family protein